MTSSCEVLGQRLPLLHVDLEVHEVEGLVEARGGGGPDDDVLGDLGEPQVVVDGPADEVGGVDDAPSPGPE